MNISKTDKNKAKIIFSDKELRSLDISYETFTNNEYAAKLFIGSIITMLNELDIIKINSGEIAVDIVKSPRNGITVYIESRPCKNKEEELMYIFNSPSELIDFCKNQIVRFYEYICSSELYLYENSYILSISSNASKNAVSKIQSLKNYYGNTEILKGKIKEYGEKISNTPIKKILELP